MQCCVVKKKIKGSVFLVERTGDLLISLSYALSPQVVTPLKSATHSQCDVRPTVTFPERRYQFCSVSAAQRCEHLSKVAMLKLHYFFHNFVYNRGVCAHYAAAF